MRKQMFIESDNLTEKEIQKLVSRIEDVMLNRPNGGRLLIEVIQQSMSIDVKVGSILDDSVHIPVRGIESIIDWENYDF
jgi:hypothetical protein